MKKYCYVNIANCISNKEIMKMLTNNNSLYTIDKKLLI